VTNPNGTRAETALVNWLHANGHGEAYRLAKAGARDVGDIGGLPLTIQVKARRAMDLAGWVDDAQVQASNAGNDVGVVFHKRKGKGNPGEWYCTLPVAAFIELFGELLT
jgi:hypothetical protein